MNTQNQDSQAANQVPAPATPATTATVGVPTPASGPVGGPPQPSPLMSILPFIVMMGIAYFLIIRPQQKKMKEHQASVEKLKQGDEVVTQGGIFGTITSIVDRVVTLEIAKGVQIRILKSQINPIARPEK